MIGVEESELGADFCDRGRGLDEKPLGLRDFPVEEELVRCGVESGGECRGELACCHPYVCCELG
ncbi:Uncharacterised protein [Mycobacteroides abscessus subsp. abscessus]|nr:Uncharacterised protein [Mycobacteroides abscessus subsp. abscessus]